MKGLEGFSSEESKKHNITEFSKDTAIEIGFDGFRSKIHNFEKLNIGDVIEEIKDVLKKINIYFLEIPTDSEGQKQLSLISNLKKKLTLILDNLLAIKQFEMEISGDLDDNISLKKAAVKSARERVTELIQELNSVPIEKKVLNLRVKKNLGTLIKSLAASLILFLPQATKPEPEDKGLLTTSNIEIIFDYEYQKSTKGLYGGNIDKANQLVNDEEENLFRQDVQNDIFAVGNEGSRHEGGLHENAESTEKKKPFASIKFVDGSTIRDSLWVTNFILQKEDRKFYYHTPELETKNLKPQAEVTIGPITVKEGKKITLPIPLNHSLNKLKVEPQIKCQFNPQNRTLEFKESAEGVQIVYSVVEAKVVIPNLVERSSTWSEEEADELLKFSGVKSYEIVEILDDYLSGFVYVSSNDMQDIFDLLPGEIQQKTQYLKVGDCDSLSMLVSDILSRMQHKSFVVVGFSEKDKSLANSDAHAKVVYLKGDQLTTYESTRNVEKSFVKLKFNKEDKETLMTLAKEVSDSVSHPSRVQAFKTLRETLHHILSKEEYQKFESDSDSSDMSDFEKYDSSSVKDSMDKLLNKISETFDLSNPDLNIKNFIFSISSLVLTILPILGSVKLTNVISIRQAKKLRGELDLKSLGFLGKIMSLEKIYDMTVQSDSRILNMVKEFYEANPELSDYVIAEEEVAKWDRGTQLEYLRAISLSEIMMTRNPDGVVDLFLAILTNRQYDRQLESLIKQNPGLTDLVKMMEEIVVDQKQREIDKERIGERLEIIFERGRKKIVGIYGKDNNAKITAEQIIASLPNLNDVGEDVGRRKSSESGTEFFEHSLYRPGMDTRRVDWKASARSSANKILVKKFDERSRSESSDNTYTILINLENSRYDLEEFTALLLYCISNPDKAHIEKIVFLSKGNVVDVIESTTLRKTFKKGNPEVIKQIIRKVLELEIEQSILPFVKENSSFGGQQRYSYNVSVLPPNLSVKGKVLGVGFHDNNFDSNLSNIFDGFFYHEDTNQS